MKSIEEMIKDEAEEAFPDFWPLTSVFAGQNIPHNEKRRDGYITGRSKSIEAEKKKDERIKELEDELRKIEAMSWRKSEWKEMEEINNYVRQLLNNK